MYDDKIKYYNLYTFTTTKDERGEVIRSFVLNKQIRGFFREKTNTLIQENKGLVVNYNYLFITTKKYKDDIKIGDKIEDYIVSSIHLNGWDLVVELKNKE